MKKCNYNYLVQDISDDEGTGYAAIIAKFPKILVMADTLEELNVAVIDAIEIDIKERKKDGSPIPPPDKDANFKGKIILRTTPELHERLYHEAQASQMSLNKYIESKLKSDFF